VRSKLNKWSNNYNLQGNIEVNIIDPSKNWNPVSEYKLDGFVLTKDHISVQVETKVEHTQAYTPHVIEPSFGIGRILYCMIEHVFWSREADEQRCVLSLPALVAPYKCLLVPLSKNMVFKPLLSDICKWAFFLRISLAYNDQLANYEMPIWRASWTTRLHRSANAMLEMTSLVHLLASQLISRVSKIIPWHCVSEIPPNRSGKRYFDVFVWPDLMLTLHLDWSSGAYRERTNKWKDAMEWCDRS